MENTGLKILLRLSGLTKRFGGVPALDDVSFRVAEGQFTALIGPNGAGKTTLINCLSGVLQPDKGDILYEGENLAGLPPHEVARRGIARTFQNLRIFPRLTILDNVLTGLTVQAGNSYLKALLRTPGLRHRERRLKLTALEALDTFGLAEPREPPHLEPRHYPPQHRQPQTPQPQHREPPHLEPRHYPPQHRQPQTPQPQHRQP